ncbi:hypothetical protein RHMOL_Rhmol10G0004900 [Rhododendron molle]|uniref:Uncharacterized protein n=1 Tax=Rhododendron molle TaxID=49168 RepID=A0ACC0LXD6_RHOML|nr:hypothetical protein RHMOL_Rhmol10G0004900 [Rhododendron molle]
MIKVVGEGEKRWESRIPYKPTFVSRQKWRDSVRKGERTNHRRLPSARAVHHLVGSSSYLHRCLCLVKVKLIL